MLKKSRIAVFAAIISVSTALSFVASRPAQAFFLNPFESMVDSQLKIINSTTDSTLTTTLALSDDIGTMADRILVMSDNIGIMADRIVTTEEMLAEILMNTSNSSNSAAPLLTYPAEGDYISVSTPVQLTISTEANDYVLFISNTSDMNNGTNILVQGGDTTAAWNRLAEYATGSELYMAVKTVDNGTMGSISNTVMVNLTE